VDNEENFGINSKLITTSGNDIRRHLKLPVIYKTCTSENL